eukprot:1411890-Ditylum_brightwellii.AAC.1
MSKKVLPRTVPAASWTPIQASGGGSISHICVGCWCRRCRRVCQYSRLLCITGVRWIYVSGVCHVVRRSENEPMLPSRAGTALCKLPSRQCQHFLE